VCPALRCDDIDEIESRVKIGNAQQALDTPIDRYHTALQRWVERFVVFDLLQGKVEVWIGTKAGNRLSEGAGSLSRAVNHAEAGVLRDNPALPCWIWSAARVVKPIAERAIFVGIIPFTRSERVWSVSDAKDRIRRWRNNHQVTNHQR
jgi:hypothetical protein